jgi:hypothetical protein
MADYLSELLTSDAPLNKDSDVVSAASLGLGGDPTRSRLELLTREQLADLCRAYELTSTDPAKPALTDWPKPALLAKLRVLEEDSFFKLNQPKNLYYFMRARYTADQIQDAKYGKGANGQQLPRGYFQDSQRNIRRCAALFPWEGPDPDAAPTKPVEETKPARKMSDDEIGYRQLQGMAKKLGMNTMGQTKESMQAFIDEKIAALKALETTTVTESDGPDDDAPLAA